MDLKSGQLYWPTQNGKSPSLAALRRDVRCEVAVLGGGLTGALVARALCREGIDTVLLDKRGVGAGSTSASTALIQYEIDVPLFQLIGMRGRRAAVRSYRLCREAIDELSRVVGELGDACRFVRRRSLYLGRSREDARELEREFRERKRAGFQLGLLDRREVEGRFSFSAPAALLSADGAEIDPLRFTQRLVGDALKAGLRAYAPVTVRRIDATRSAVTLRTEGGFSVSAGRVVVAAGYESTEFLRRKLVRLRSTYAMATEPVRCFDGWAERCLIWEAGRPYHYLRTTHDGRLLIGGGDVDFVSAKKRDRLIARKARDLRRKLEGMFPGIGIKPAFAWAGAFGDTKDGLPCIGSVPAARRILFTLCYGANGTNFAVLGAKLARDWVMQKRNRDAALFALDR